MAVCSRGVRRRTRSRLLAVLTVFSAINSVDALACNSSQCDGSTETSLCLETGIRLPGAKSLSVATQAAANPYKSDFSPHKTKMSDQPSLAEKLASLADSNEFTNRLLVEVQAYNIDRNTISKSRRKDYRKIWMAAGATTLVATAYLFVVPMAFPGSDPMVLSSASSVLALLPWNNFSKSTSMLVMDIMAVVQLLSRDQVRGYVRDKVLPSAWSTLHKMLLMEFWRRVWKFAGTQINRVVQEYTNSDKESSKEWQDSLPSWLTKTHEFCKETIQRGTYKLMQRSVQRRVTATIVELFEALAKQAETCIQSLLQTPQPIAITAS